MGKPILFKDTPTSCCCFWWNTTVSFAFWLCSANSRVGERNKAYREKLHNSSPKPKERKGQEIQLPNKIKKKLESSGLWLLTSTSPHIWLPVVLWRWYPPIARLRDRTRRSFQCRSATAPEALSAGAQFHSVPGCCQGTMTSRPFRIGRIAP